MQWIIDHSLGLLMILLSITELAAAVCQVLFPSNKGIAGFLAGVIKLLQTLGAKSPESVQ